MKTVTLLLILTLGGCTSSKKKSLSIAPSDQNKAITINGLDYAALDALRSDTAGSQWQNLVPVYRMPLDTDMKDYQKAQPGKYAITGGSVVFTPDTPFMATQVYFVRWYHHAEGINVLDVIKKGTKLGNMPYTDLIFKL